MLGYDVNGAFFRRGKVTERVLCIGKAAGEAYYKERWIVVYNLSIGERGEVSG